jgi:pimeloyl-ACP methyl ester carboxylesterase
MHVSIGDVRLFVDVSGPALVPDGGAMRERPTVVMLHGGPGIDHSPFKQPIFSPLTEIAQVIYYDQRGHGRSDRGSRVIGISILGRTTCAACATRSAFLIRLCLAVRSAASSP